MNARAYLKSRNKYRYPAVGLQGSVSQLEVREFSTIRAMEKHHRRLLRSKDDADVVFGYLSVLYWGHYSGQDRRTRGARALARVRLATTRVSDLGVPEVAARLRRAIELLDAAKPGEALVELSQLPQLKFAFASKVCAFILPEKCGVVDSVIANARRRFKFEVDRGGFVRKNSANAARYADYCAFLVRKASDLNARGQAFKWRDRDGTRCSWRAVDVERAMYET
jgi:hypothetical protein